MNNAVTSSNSSNKIQRFFDRQQIIARNGFNRWLVPPAALSVHLCIGMAYGFSVFWLPLSHALSIANGRIFPACSGSAKTFMEKTLGTFQALTATNCEWTQFDLGWMFTLFFVFLGCSAAIFGGWLERVGPRLAGCVATLCWCFGLVIGAVGIYTHELWLLWIGPGAIGGIGLGLGYISPVSLLIKWFPDRRGMATGMAIMGFGGGAMIGSPLANILINGGYFIEWKGIFSYLHFDGFKTASSPGVWQTFLVLACGYFIYMLAGSLAYRIPPIGWQPKGWTPTIAKSAIISENNVHLNDVHKTSQFWLIWLVLCLNVSAGIGIIGAASPMLQETFGGTLFNLPQIDFLKFSDEQKILAATVGSGFVGLFSLFNIGGRFFWASLSDKIGRKTVYFIFFILGIICYGFAPTLADHKHLALYACFLCVIASMYGGGFATIPAYLADIFGTKYVGAIHGRLLTAWSTAGIIGPVIVNYLHDARVSEGLPSSHVYDLIFYTLGFLLIIGLICNFLIQPVHSKWHIEDENAILSGTSPDESSIHNHISTGINLGKFDYQALFAWTVVGFPLVWGILKTVQNALRIIQ